MKSFVVTTSHPATFSVNRVATALWRRFSPVVLAAAMAAGTIGTTTSPTIAMAGAIAAGAVGFAPKANAAATETIAIASATDNVTVQDSNWLYDVTSGDGRTGQLLKFANRNLQLGEELPEATNFFSVKTANVMRDPRIRARALRYTFQVSDDTGKVLDKIPMERHFYALKAARNGSGYTCLLEITRNLRTGEYTPRLILRRSAVGSADVTKFSEYVSSNSGNVYELKKMGEPLHASAVVAALGSLDKSKAELMLGDLRNRNAHASVVWSATKSEHCAMVQKASSGALVKNSGLKGLEKLLKELSTKVKEVAKDWIDKTIDEAIDSLIKVLGILFDVVERVLGWFGL